MSTWAKIKFYYDSMLNADGAVVAASSTETTGDYDVDYLSNWLEINSWKAASSATTTITCTANGQIINGDFETGDLTGWSYYVAGTGVINAVTVETASPWEGTYYAKIDITNTGSAYSDIVFFHNPEITGIKKGRVYKLLFACKAQAAATIKLSLIQNTSPYYGVADSQTQAVTTLWAHYELTFTAVRDMDDLRVSFYLGNGADWYEFDNIVFAEEEAVCADYAVAHGHNFLPLTGAVPTLKLEYSDDNSSWTVVDTGLDGDTVHTFGTILWEFTKTGAHKYWKWSTISPGNTTEIQLLAWGLKAELDYASAGFDPHAQKHMVNQNVSYGGYVTGIHEQFIERSMSLNFNDADSTLYTKIKRWIDNHGPKNLFVAWELANEPNEVFLMRPEPGFNNPLTNNGAYRNITINLLGRKE